LDVNGTAHFLGVFIKMWKIINVRRMSDDQRLRDPDRQILNSSNDQRLDFLISLAEMVENMNAENGLHRVKTLTIETAGALSHTLRGLVALAKHLLTTTHDFVMLGEFSSDPLEKAFSKLRQGSGGSYFITVQQVLEKLNINHAKLLLQMDANFFDKVDGHQCVACLRDFNEKESDIFDNLDSLQCGLSDSVKKSLVYIAGYVAHKAGVNKEDTTSYYEQYGSYLDRLNRGGLTKPGDELTQWVFFCYILFAYLDTKTNVCRNSLSRYFNLIHDFYFFGCTCNNSFKAKMSSILSNIFLNNFSKLVTPRSGKEPAQKVLKLS
jgi:hypothetical protein